MVTSVGASCQALVNAGVPAMATPNVGDITVSSGLSLAGHVINTNCCQWQGGKGEAVSICVMIYSTKLPFLLKTPENNVMVYEGRKRKHHRCNGKRNKAKDSEHWQRLRQISNPQRT